MVLGADVDDGEDVLDVGGATHVHPPTLRGGPCKESLQQWCETLIRVRLPHHPHLLHNLLGLCDKVLSAQPTAEGGAVLQHRQPLTQQTQQMQWRPPPHTLLHRTTYGGLADCTVLATATLTSTHTHQQQGECGQSAHRTQCPVQHWAVVVAVPKHLRNCVQRCVVLRHHR
uniref:Folic acid synthesis protein FOL1 n=1 Tax=Lygus hesperus TaxID=30085 RepID=A0A0A9VZW5_LYGHE